MIKEVTIPAGDVLTVNLLKKLKKEAYQFGGLKTFGGLIKKTPFNLNAKTVVIIHKSHIKGDINKFINEFNKTMNSWYYEILIK